jgi:hypothetical protein
LDIEHDEGKATIEIRRAISARRRTRQYDLAADYRDQFARHERARQLEKQLDRLEGDELKRMEAEDAARKHERQQQLQQLARQRNDAFMRCIDELLQRKQRRIEDKLLIDQEVQQQSAEANGRFAARRAR